MRSATQKPVDIWNSVAVCRHENETYRRLSMSRELSPALCCSNRDLSGSVERSLLLSVGISQVNSHSKRGRRGETTRQRRQRNISTLPVLNSETWRTSTEMIDEISGFMSEALSGKANICFVLQSMTKRVSTCVNALKPPCNGNDVVEWWSGGVMMWWSDSQRCLGISITCEAWAALCIIIN